MLIIPAIDIKNGACVRLKQGDPGQETVYSEDPVAVAKKWASMGAKRLHVVDLDGALGQGDNLGILKKLREAVACEIEFGGGLRESAQIKTVLDLNIDRAIVGTSLFKNVPWIKEVMKTYPGRLMAGVDVLDGEVKVEGWQKGSGLQTREALEKIEAMGFKEIIFTDISKDGMLQGAALKSTREVIKSTKMKVYASGGVSSLADLKALKLLEFDGLKGCIVGKALYDGRLDFAQALSLS